MTDEQIAAAKALPTEVLERELMRRRHPLGGKDVERVLCAALWLDTGKDEKPTAYAYPKTGLLFCGWRHSECIHAMHAWATASLDRAQLVSDFRREKGLMDAQGFLTSHGRFVSREEAAKIAYEAGQIPYEVSALMSENLY